MTHVACRQPTDAQRLGQRHQRCVDEAQTEVGKAPVDFHGARELRECRRCIREGAMREILKKSSKSEINPAPHVIENKCNCPGWLVSAILALTDDSIGAL